MPAQGPGISTKPYLVRAIYEWCTDSGYRPFIAVAVDERTRVPLEFVRDGEIVLNISAEATDRLHIGNELLEFDARFGGVARHVSVPIDNIGAIFAQETGHGMAFEVQPVHARPTDPVETDDDGQAPGAAAPVDGPEEGPVEGGKPAGVRTAAADRNDGRTARKSSRRKTPAAAVPELREQGTEDGATPGTSTTPARRAPTKRARKTILRDVSAPVEERTTPAADPGRRDGDDPDPDGPKPGKPRLTRIK